jgi:hypothetical protein
MGRPLDEDDVINALRVAYWDENIQSAKDDPCIVDVMTDWAIRQVKALPSAQVIPVDLLAHKIDATNLIGWITPPSAQPEILACGEGELNVPDWDEMIVICDCCGHAIHVKRQ